MGCYQRRTYRPPHQKAEVDHWHTLRNDPDTAENPQRKTKKEEDLKKTVEDESRESEITRGEVKALAANCVRWR